jgi:hypothetical protein
VGLVHQDEDVGAGIDIGWHIVKLVDHGDDQAACVLAQQFLQVAFALAK